MDFWIEIAIWIYHTNIDVWNRRERGLPIRVTLSTSDKEDRQIPDLAYQDESTIANATPVTSHSRCGGCGSSPGWRRGLRALVWKAISQISMAWLKHCLCIVPCISSSKSQLGDVNPTFLAHSIILGFLWVICNLITLVFPRMGFLQETQYTLDFTLVFRRFPLLVNFKHLLYR